MERRLSEAKFGIEGTPGIIHFRSYVPILIGSHGISSLPFGESGKLFVCMYMHLYVELGPLGILGMSPLDGAQPAWQD